MLYGFFSEMAIASERSTSIYSSTLGKEVEVTYVANDAEGKYYLWPDKVCVGEVFQCLRRGSVPDPVTVWPSGIKKDKRTISF
jgi:hypothetical protein